MNQNNEFNCQDRLQIPRNCYIQGPMGPPGPEASIDSILVGNDGTQLVPADGRINFGTLINNTGTAFTFQTPNQVIINEVGTYLINVSSIIRNGGAGDMGISLAINQEIIPTASEYISSQTAAFSSELQHNYNATAGDSITLINTASGNNNYHDITLSIIKLR